MIDAFFSNLGPVPRKSDLLEVWDGILYFKSAKPYKRVPLAVREGDHIIVNADVGSNYTTACNGYHFDFGQERIRLLHRARNKRGRHLTVVLSQEFFTESTAAQVVLTALLKGI